MSKEYTFKVDSSQFERIKKMQKLLEEFKAISKEETAHLKTLIAGEEEKHVLFHTFYLIALNEHLENCDMDLFMYERKLERLKEEADNE